MFRIAQYEVFEKLGEGAMGEVYRARDLMVNRMVAIKLLRRDLASNSDLNQRYRQEAEALAKLNHPNIATLFNFFEHNGRYVMAMEYVSGRPLDQVLHEEGRVAPDSAAALAAQVLDALAHAHTQGVVHRDIKPANLMLTEAGAIKVMDFGIARIASSAAITDRGSLMGTVEYVAPERLQGNPAGERSDLYSAGIVLYELLTGHLPFEREHVADLVQAHIGVSVPAMSQLGVNVPPALENVVRIALAKYPASRFENASAMRAAVLRATSRGDHPRQPTANLCYRARNGALWFTISGIILLAVLLVAYLQLPERGRSAGEVKPVEAESHNERVQPPLPDWMKDAVPVNIQPAREQNGREREQRRREALKALGIDDEARSGRFPQ